MQNRCSIVQRRAVARCFVSSPSHHAITPRLRSYLLMLTVCETSQPSQPIRDVTGLFMFRARVMSRKLVLDGAAHQRSRTVDTDGSRPGEWRSCSRQLWRPFLSVRRRVVIVKHRVIVVMHFRRERRIWRGGQCAQKHPRQLPCSARARHLKSVAPRKRCGRQAIHLYVGSCVTA